MHLSPVTPASGVGFFFLQLLRCASPELASRVLPPPLCPEHHYPSLCAYRRTSFYCASQMLWFLEIEGLWPPCVQQVCRRYFPSSVCSFHVSVSHFGNSCNISNVFVIMFVINIRLEQMRSCFLLMNQESGVLSWNLIPVKMPWRLLKWQQRIENTTDVADEAAAGFQRLDANFERRSAVGKMLASSVAGYRRIVRERSSLLHCCLILGNCHSLCLLI